jgi:hypothetical protein
MNKAIWWAILILGYTLVFSSCKSKKQGGGNTQKDKTEESVIKTNPKAVLIKQIEANENKISYYYATGQINYKDEKNRQELGLGLTMEKDKYVHLNITALLGITVAKIFATPDSLVILDILNRKAIIAQYDYVSKLMGTPLELRHIQQMVLGNTIFKNNPETSTIDTLPMGIEVFQTITPQLKQVTTYALQQPYKVKKVQLYEDKGRKELMVDYTNSYADKSNLPDKFTITTKAEKTSEAQIELKTITFEKKKEIQFSIPRSYEVIRQ